MKVPTLLTFYFRSMGKALEITHTFTEEKACNKWLSTHPDFGVIGELPTDKGALILVANLHDPGIKVTR